MLADEVVNGGADGRGLGRACMGAKPTIRPLLIIRSEDARRARSHGTEELDPSLWPDVASTTPATIMVHGTPLTLPERGTPMRVPGPWKTGRKAITQRKAETADEFAVRCQEQIDAELVRAEPPMLPTHALKGVPR